MAAVNIQFPGNLAQVDTAADLRGIPSSLIASGTLYLVSDLEGVFEYDSASTAADDATTIIKPTDRNPLETGRWIKNAKGLASGKDGNTGPADNTYTSLAALLASDPSRKSARLVPQAGETEPAGNFSYINGMWVRQQADGLAYTLPAQAAQPQTQADKNDQVIDLLDFMTNGDRTIFFLGGYKDLGYAVKAACAEASGANSLTTVGGRRLRLPSGRISSSEPIKNTTRGDLGIDNDGDCRRMTVEGSGPGNCLFYYEGDPSQAAVQIRGHNSDTGRNMKAELRGFSLRRQNGGGAIGVGIDLDTVANVLIDNVDVEAFNIGINARSVLGFLAINLSLLGNNSGLAAARNGGFTRPNVWKFIGGSISGNSTYGAEFREGCCVTFDGTRFEANGFDGSGVESNKGNQFVLRMLQAPAEGGHWLTLKGGCYFENNNVSTEVLLTSDTDRSAVASIESSSFARISNTRNPDRHLDFAMTGTGRLGVKLDTILFASLNNRTPNPAYSSWRNQSEKTIVTLVNVMHDLPQEGPNTGNFPVIGNAYPVLDVLINADGSYNTDPMVTTNVKEVIKTGIGKYTVNFKTMPSNAASVRYLTDVSGNTGDAIDVLRTSGGVDVEVYDSQSPPQLVDRAFVIQGTGSFA